MRAFVAIGKLIWTFLCDTLRDLRDGWAAFWFTPVDPVTLGAVRVCTGLVVLYLYASIYPMHLDFVGPNAWVDRTAMAQIQEAAAAEPVAGESDNRWWGWSIWMWTTSNRAASACYGIFLAATICFTIGLCSRSANLLVWLGHLSFVHRSYVAWYGMDAIVAMLLLYLLFGPTGAALSVDAWWKRRSKTAPQSDSNGLPRRSWTANFSLRMIQVHMCMIYLCSGVAKLRGTTWWDGTAIWRSLMNDDLSRFDFRWLANFSDQSIDFISASGTFFTIAWEVSFAFLIWNRRLRPFVLFGGVLLHLGIGLLMGLEGFAAIMLAGCLAFVPPAGLRSFFEILSRNK